MVTYKFESTDQRNYPDLPKEVKDLLPNPEDIQKGGPDASEPGSGHGGER